MVAVVGNVRGSVNVRHKQFLSYTVFVLHRVVSLLLCYHSNKIVKCSQTNISNDISCKKEFMQSLYKRIAYMSVPLQVDHVFHFAV